MLDISALSVDLLFLFVGPVACACTGQRVIVFFLPLSLHFVESIQYIPFREPKSYIVLDVHIQ